MIRIVLLGPPGAGKGSLASLCEQRLKLSHLSTGQIFREEIARNTAVGKRVQRFVATGRLAPDNLVVQVMSSFLSPNRLAKGFVLDGFPRTRGQAAGLDRLLQHKKAPLQGAVYLSTPQHILIRRLSGRRVCSKCGANYHLRTMRPKKAGYCDRCKSPLMTRKDDVPATIKRRLEVDQKASKPLMDYYRRRNLLHEISGSGRLESEFSRMMRLFKDLGWSSKLKIITSDSKKITKKNLKRSNTIKTGSR